MPGSEPGLEEACRKLWFPSPSVLLLLPNLCGPLRKASGLRHPSPVTTCPAYGFLRVARLTRCHRLNGQTLAGTTGPFHPSQLMVEETYLSGEEAPGRGTEEEQQRVQQSPRSSALTVPLGTALDPLLHLLPRYRFPRHWHFVLGPWTFLMSTV